jgi:hypothetical protein
MTEAIAANPFDTLPAGWQDRLHERLSAMAVEERDAWFAGMRADIANIEAKFAEMREEAREQIRLQEEQLAARQRALDEERRRVAERRAAIGK